MARVASRHYVYIKASHFFCTRYRPPRSVTVAPKMLARGLSAPRGESAPLTLTLAGLAGDCVSRPGSAACSPASQEWQRGPLDPYAAASPRPLSRSPSSVLRPSCSWPRHWVPTPIPGLSGSKVFAPPAPPFPAGKGLRGSPPLPVCYAALALGPSGTSWSFVPNSATTLSCWSCGTNSS